MLIALEKSDHAYFGSPLVDLLSGAKGYAHAELLFDNGMSLTAATDVGLIIRPRSFARDCWTFFDIGKELGEGKIRNWYNAERDANPDSKYDWAGDFRFVVPFIKQHPRDWFCSEAVVAAVQQVGLFTWVKPWKIAPNDLLGLCRDYGFREREWL